MKNQVLLFLFVGLVTFSACKKTATETTNDSADNTTPTYTVPDTYVFGSNMNYTLATAHINMAKELIGYIRSTHSVTASIVLDANKLKGMFLNTAGSFTDVSLSNAAQSLNAKMNDAYGLKSGFETLLNEIASVSAGTTAAQNGTPGKLIGTNSSGTQSAWLLDKNGFEYKELVEKGVMGAVFYSEAMLLLKNIESYDNSTVVAGEGTAMEHAWDLAFGYFGAPAAFPSTTTGLSYWGSYCNSVNAAINSNATMMNAFLKGRAAISGKDLGVMLEARNTLVVTWEKFAAAKLVNYLKGAKSNLALDGQRSHNLSEAIGFVRAFRYNSAKIITDVQIDQQLQLLGNNFYNITSTAIDQLISNLCSIYSLDASKL
jgi:hypothetical protein